MTEYFCFYQVFSVEMRILFTFGKHYFALMYFTEFNKNNKIFEENLLKLYWLTEKRK